MATITVDEAMAQICATIRSKVELLEDGEAALWAWMNKERNTADMLHCEVLATADGQRMWPVLVRRLARMDLVAIQGDSPQFDAAAVRRLEEAMQSHTIFCSGPDEPPSGGP